MEAVPVQGLLFGPMLPGIPEQIAVGDAARRAEILLTGSGVLDVSIQLPRAMTAPGGATIPLRFGPHDAAVLYSASSAPVPVNPLELIRVRLDPAAGPTRLLLGGTALPAANQQAGTYTTTLVLLVVNTGT
jgi:hypothetical protein